MIMSKASNMHTASSLTSQTATLKVNNEEKMSDPLQTKDFSHFLVAEANENLMLSVGYLNKDEQSEILKASYFGDVAHIKDKRKSGEPYITHPIAVAEILAGFKLDKDTIIAAILHDTVEDTDVTLDDLTTNFGDTVANLVDGVTKLKSSKQNKQQNKAATFHKILIATLEDPRVLVIKLSDRLHNMSTLGAVRPEKQRATAQETLDFYIPFARVMGMNDLANHIEILCYRNLDPDMYTILSDKLLQHGLGRKFRKDEIYEYLRRLINRKELKGHVKPLDNKVAMYRQFFNNRGTADQLIRQYACEVILEDVSACNVLSEFLINRYQISPKHISDNIRNPLPGGNQSLTLTYIYQNDIIKVTILTKHMQEAARLGVVGADNSNEISQSVIQASLRNMKSLVNTQNQEHAHNTNNDDALTNIDDAVNTIDQLMNYLHERKIVCYSPMNKAYELPRNATVLDFAYAVGPKVGNVAVSAMVDDEPADLATILQNGQTVNIITEANSTPKAEWLGFVLTGKARDLIQKWLKQLSDEDKVIQGKQALDRALQTFDKTIDDLSEKDWHELLTWRNQTDKNALFTCISAGQLLPQLVLSRLFSEEMAKLNQQNDNQSKGLIANLGSGVEISIPKCCNPVYGDPILGHNSKSHGLVIHRHKCFTLDDIRKQFPKQIFKIEWQKVDKEKPGERPHYHAYLQVCAQMSDDKISEAILRLRKINVGVEKVESKDINTNIFIIVRGRDHIAQAIRELRNLLEFPNIIRLYQSPA